MAGTRDHPRAGRVAAAAATACVAAVLVANGRDPAARAAACDAARVTFPVAGAELAGSVGVFGSAEIDAFQFYKVEYAAAAAPEAWSATSDVVRRPARHARLDRWATAAVPDGRYRLKLTIVDTTAQERCRVVVDDLTVANRAAASTTPAADATGMAVATGSAAAAMAVAIGRDALWPTAVRRVALQGAPVVGALTETTAAATGALTATDALTDAAPLTATDGTTSTASGGAAASSNDAGEGDGSDEGAATDAAGARLASRFGWSFALGFAAVAVVMAVLARRARRGAGGAPGR